MTKLAKKLKHVEEYLKKAEKFAYDVCKKNNIDIDSIYYELILNSYISGMVDTMQKVGKIVGL